MANYNDYIKMLNFILNMEGGYVNNSFDKGGETNKGITKITYDNYRKSKNLPLKSVKNIDNSEIQEIYYNNYYIASGANNIDDPKLALYVFDTAVNMGVSVAKKLLQESNGDINEYEKLRREKYQKYVNFDASQGRFLQGWNNRVDKLKLYALQTFPENNLKYDLNIEMNVDKNGNFINDINEFLNIKMFKNKFKKIINKFLNKKFDNLSFNNECTGSYTVNGYTRSDGTKVKEYVRTCGKHNKMSMEERVKGQAKYKGKRFQDIPADELEEAIGYFV